jgi:hypothetical protein
MRHVPARVRCCIVHPVVFDFTIVGNCCPVGNEFTVFKQQ